MKNFVLLFIIFCINLTANATTIQGQVTFDWAEKSQIERDKNIEYVKSILDTASVNYTKNEIKQMFSDKLKDANYKKHYIDIRNGKKENLTENMAGFFKAGDTLLYMYAIQYKNDLKNVFYYNALGKLYYIDFRSDNYPNYPYFTYQYRVSGKKIGSIYFIAPDTQYVFNENGKFVGIWYKSNMYNKNGKKILTRSNY